MRRVWLRADAVDTQLLCSSNKAAVFRDGGEGFELGEVASAHLGPTLHYVCLA